jgi:hypothetical protein
MHTDQNNASPIKALAISNRTKVDFNLLEANPLHIHANSDIKAKKCQGLASEHHVKVTFAASCH